MCRYAKTTFYIVFTNQSLAMQLKRGDM